MKKFSYPIFIVLICLQLLSCNDPNNNNSTTPTLQSQVVGNWKLVKEHWQGYGNNTDTIITSWSTSSGAAIPPTIEFGTQVLGQWFSGGLDKMGWGGPAYNPFTRGGSHVNSLWAIEASTNRLIGAAGAKYDVVYIDANNMVLSQENQNNQYSFDTLWLERF